jgi:hypothetical protein
MHNHSDLRRFFGTQPFFYYLSVSCFVPQNDMTSAPPFICHSEELVPTRRERISAPQCTNPNLSSLPLSVILNPKTLWQCYNSQIAPYLLFVVIRGEESPNLSAPLPSLSSLPRSCHSEERSDEESPHPNAQSLRPSQILRNTTIFSQSFTIPAFVPQNDTFGLLSRRQVTKRRRKPLQLINQSTIKLLTNLSFWWTKWRRICDNQCISLNLSFWTPRLYDSVIILKLHRIFYS